MNKIKLIIALNIMDIGGAERTVQTLALHLNREVFDLTILCIEKGGTRVKALEQAGVKILIGNGTIDRIKELIPCPDFDILHFHRSGHHENLHEAVVNYLKPKKLMETNVFAFQDEALKLRFDLQVYKSIMMMTQRVWKTQKPASDWWKRQRVIYNPVTIIDFDKYRLSASEIFKMRKNFGFTDSDIVVGRVGRKDSVKWGDLFLVALPYIIDRLPQVKFIFRTVPPSRIEWLKKKGYLGKSVFVLPESASEQEVAETYQILDIYLHPSRRGEAFGNTLNEAMVWALPIIVENTPHWDNGQLEQVENNFNGLVVRSVGGLIEALSFLANNREKRKEYGRNGRLKVERDFSTIVGLNQYESSYLYLTGKISEQEWKDKLFPSCQMVEQYSLSYPEKKRLDFPHKFSLSQDIKKIICLSRWKVFDSLVARNIIH